MLQLSQQDLLQTSLSHCVTVLETCDLFCLRFCLGKPLGFEGHRPLMVVKASLRRDNEVRLHIG